MTGELHPVLAAVVSGMGESALHCSRCDRDRNSRNGFSYLRFYEEEALLWAPKPQTLNP